MAHIYFPALRAGKSRLIEFMRDEFIRRNPTATMGTFRNGELIVEKFAGTNAQAAPSATDKHEAGEGK
jgi:hypothetical protein